MPDGWDRETSLLLASVITYTPSNKGSHTYHTVETGNSSDVQYHGTSTMRLPRSMVPSSRHLASTSPFAGMTSGLHEMVSALAMERAGQPVHVVRCSEYNESPVCKNIVFDLGGPGAHYCPFVGRNHKSFRSYYVVQLPNYQFRQKCRDPLCQNRYTDWFPLPLSDNERLSGITSIQ